MISPIELSHLQRVAHGSDKSDRRSSIAKWLITNRIACRRRHPPPSRPAECFGSSTTRSTRSPGRCNSGRSSGSLRKASLSTSSYAAKASALAMQIRSDRSASALIADSMCGRSPKAPPQGLSTSIRYEHRPRGGRRRRAVVPTGKTGISSRRSLPSSG